MMTSEKTPLQASASRWLRRRIWREAFYQMVEGGILCFLGMLVLAGTAGMTALFLMFAGRGLLPKIFMSSFHEMFTLLTVLFLLVAAGSFLGALWREVRRNKRDFAVAAAKGSEIKIGDVFFSGPRVMFNGCRSFGKAQSLLRLDIPQTTNIMLWLWRRGRKATVAEVAAQFPGYNISSILPRLRDIPGVVWLTMFHGAIALSQEFQDEFFFCAARRGRFPEKGSPFAGSREAHRSAAAFYRCRRRNRMV